jgi:hypothetical protein
MDRMENQPIRKAFTGCLLVFVSTLWAQVNTEALRPDSQLLGLHSTLGANLGYIAGNSNLYQLRSNLRFEFVRNRGQAFLVAQYHYGRQDEVDFINKGFMHLRGVKTITPFVYIEGFVQKEFNEFILLEDRQLAGGGARLLWHQLGPHEEQGPLRITTGIGFMWEQEQLDFSSIPDSLIQEGEASLSSIIRSTNYLVLNWRLDDRSSLLTTAYYQFHPADMADFRILLESRLQFSLFQKTPRQLAFNVGLNLRYDHKPPTMNIDPYDIEITNGITYSF